MTQNDPTDHALAAIAKILDKPETPDIPDKTETESPAEKPELQLAEEILAAPPSAPPPPVVEAVAEAEPADDNKPAENEPAENEDTDSEDVEAADTAINLAEIDLAENNTYTKLGPGPLAAIRFKWTARRDDHGDYFVDETIGENSHPIVNGPMTKEAAIKLVDLRERQARQRFETLRSEMSGGEIGRSADE